MTTRASKRPHLMMPKPIVQGVEHADDPLRIVRFQSDCAAICPMLSKTEVQLLVTFPQEGPREPWQHEKKHVSRLRRLGLLHDEHMIDFQTARLGDRLCCTDLGAEVARRFCKGGWLGEGWRRVWKHAGTKGGLRVD